jgi:adenine-specific DNA methylase
MTDNTPTSKEDGEEDLTRLKIEEPLPVTATGIESLKESYTAGMSPHRKIFKWFARRPTTASRLALLASILPADTSNDELLELMGIGPKEKINGGIEEYVLNKERTKDDRDGSIEEHFGYDYPHRRLPSRDGFDSFHQILERNWDGELPTVLDPTAGGATIPFESARYGLPTISNELNPVAWLINKIVLEYARRHGSREEELTDWASKVEDIAEDELEEYYPTYKGTKPTYYYRAYSTSCPSCGQTIPLSNRWWFNRRKDVAIVPKFDSEGELYFECGQLSELDAPDNYDPNEGTVSGGDAECPHCGVITERDALTERFSDGEFDYVVCAVKYVDKVEGSKYHSPTEEDYEAISAAQERVESDLQLSTLLREDRYIGLYDRAGPYGFTQWRDLYSPRQLLSHATYLEAFEQVESQIREELDEATAEAIIVILSLIGTRQVERSSRLSPMDIHFGYPGSMLATNNYSFQWHFGESNPTAGGQSYQSFTENVIKNYEEVVDYYSERSNSETTRVLQGDAADLPVDDESVQAVVIDPPYGDNIMYAEVADASYVWLRKYLDNQFPDKFQSPETNKRDEAVENPVLVDDTKSSTDAARQRYENKMGEIFDESYRVLDRGGVITVFFTDKEISAWDALTMSLINSGFTITATHTISSELPDRIGVKGQSSADSSLLLTCRKPYTDIDKSTSTPTLWTDIKQKTRDAAREKAIELFESSPNLTKTDVIISAFGPTLRVFTEEYPVVDKYDNPVRPKQALEEARKAVTEVLIERELETGLDNVDSLSTWYILAWLVYERETIPYDEARQLGLGVGVNIDDVKSDTKIWGKSGDKIVLKGQDYRVQDYSELEKGGKRRKRAYPVSPMDESFENHIDTVHATLNVLETKGSDFTWNWINDRDLQNKDWYIDTLRNLIQVLSQDHDDYSIAKNLVSGQTGELLDIDIQIFSERSEGEGDDKTTLQDFS